MTCSVVSAPKLLRAHYLRQIYQAKQEINPKLLFVPTIYDLDQDVADRLAGCVDGVWFWWVNLEHNARDAHAVRRQPRDCRESLPHLLRRLFASNVMAQGGETYAENPPGRAGDRLPVCRRRHYLEPSSVAQYA